MKTIHRIVSSACVLLLAFTQLTTSFAVDYTPENLSEKECAKIDYLIATDEPENHIEALKILEQYGLAKEQVVFNEYDAYLKQKSALANSTSPASSTDAASIKAIESFENDFSEKIARLNTYSNDELRVFNYTDDQIYAIRNFDGSPEMMRRAASTCTVYGGFSDWKSSISGTTTTMIAAFQWNGEYPYTSLIGNKDIFATTWTGPFQSELDEEEAYATYAFRSDLKEYTYSYNTKAKGVFDSEFTFPNAKMKNFDGTPVNYLLKSGSIICHLKSKNEENMATGYASYGKNTSAVEPALRVTPDGVFPSISYTEKVDDIASDRWHY